ncbi:3862_t:CDS:2 [Funneliformis geosporum]|nr:3862_t:CDS:2 [Funneliformis geosporum]
MVLKHNLEKELKVLGKRIKTLELDKKKTEDENQLLLSYFLNEMDSKDLDSLRESLNSQRRTEMLELDNGRRDIYNLNINREKSPNNVVLKVLVISLNESNNDKCRIAGDDLSIGYVL